MEAVTNSFLRYGQKPKPEPFTAEERWAGKSFLRYHLRKILGTCRMLSHQEALEMMRRDTSPGRLWKKAGYPDKGTVIDSCSHLLEAFWDQAHLVKQPVMWSIAGKNEMLPVVKLRAGLIRTFCGAPIEHYYYGARLFGHVTKELKRATATMPLNHSVYFRGHHKLAMRLNMYLEKFAGDVSGWDRDYPAQLFEENYAFRLELYETISLELEARLAYYLSTLTESWCLLPNGEVWIKRVGNSSGHFNTTDDNTIGHCFVIGVWASKIFQCPPREMPVQLAVYADDHVGSCARKLSFEERAPHYARMGFTLKREDDVTSQDVQDLKFLGFKFKYLNGFYLPIFDRTRLFNSMIRSGRRTNVTLDNARYLGMFILGVHDPPVRQLCWEVYTGHCAIHGIEPIVDHPQDMEDWLLGLESGQLAFLSQTLRQAGCLGSAGLFEIREVSRHMKLVEKAEEAIHSTVQKAESAVQKAEKTLVAVAELGEALAESVVPTPSSQKAALTALVKAEKEIGLDPTKQVPIKPVVRKMPRSKKGKKANASAQVGAELAAKHLAAEVKKLVATVPRQPTGPPVAVPKKSFKSAFKVVSQQSGLVHKATVQCRDRLSKIAVTTTTLEGQVLLEQNLNPVTFLNTPLAVEALLWDRYRLKQITFHYDTDVATTTDGSLFMGFDPDIRDEGKYEVGTIVALQKFAAHDVCDQVSVWGRKSLTYRNPAAEYLFTRPDSGSDTYWTSPGAFVVLANGDFAANKTVGTLYFDAEYEFMGRNVEGVIQQVGGWDLISPDTATTAAPFTGSVITSNSGAAAAAVNIINFPTNPTTATIQWTELDPDQCYLAIFHFLDGTTCSGAPTVSVSTGTSVKAHVSYNSTASFASQQATPSSGGTLRLSLNSGTWVAAPQECHVFLTTVPWSTECY